MASVSIKIIGKKNLDKFYKQLLGKAKHDPVIIEPIYEKLLAGYTSFINMLIVLKKRCMQEPKVQTLELKAISDFLLFAMKELNSARITPISGDVLESADLKKLNMNPKLMKEHMSSTDPILKFGKEELCNAYAILKKSDLRSEVMECLNRMNSYKGEFAEDKVRPFFMREMYTEWQLFKFSKFDFRRFALEEDDISTYTERPGSILVYICEWLTKFYRICNDIYNTLLIPDIDVDKFVKSIIKRFEEMKKTIPRCNDAFDLLTKNTKLFKKNFPSYYKSFVTYNNPNAIINSYISDVSKSGEGNIKLLAQFRKIVSVCKKQATDAGISTGDSGGIDIIKRVEETMDTFEKLCESTEKEEKERKEMLDEETEKIDTSDPVRVEIKPRIKKDK